MRGIMAAYGISHEARTMPIVTAEECARIHAGSLEVLETLGIRVDDEEILALLRHHGARDGGDADTVRLPRELVGECLGACPETARFADRDCYIMGRTIAALGEAGLRAGLRVVIGGAPVTARFAREIGADCYAATAIEAAQQLREIARARR